jgi:chromosome segregation ATPase
MEEVKDREAKIAQFQEQAELNDFKLREQQNLLERLRTDRNAYRKLLIEQKNEMKEYRRTFIHLNHRIKQLKTEIHEKDVAFVTEHFNLEHVNSDMATLTNHNKQAEEKLTEQDEIIKKRSREIRKLTTIVADADEELRVQRKQYNTIVNEQRVLNQQLIERNEVRSYSPYSHICYSYQSFIYRSVLCCVVTGIGEPV